LAKDPVKVKTTSQIAEILGVSKSMASKIANLAPEINAKGGKINIANSQQSQSHGLAYRQFEDQRRF
jgi:hypothetical protein